MIKYVELDGVKYPINTDFKTAIKCDRILNDPEISNLDRGILLTGTLFGWETPYTEEAVNKAMLFLSDGEKSPGEDKRVLDFDQHWDYYVGAFRQAYGLNLNEIELHYHEFLSLLKSLKGTALNDIVELLTYDMSEVKDSKTRLKIKKQQALFKIKDQHVTQRRSAFLDKLPANVKGGK